MLSTWLLPRPTSRTGSALGNILGITSSFLLVGASLFLNHETMWPGAWALLPTMGAAGLIASGSINSQGVVQRLLGTTPMVWIGGLSYSLYLWHWPLVVLGQDWLGLRGPSWGAALVMASFVPAWLSYRFVEAPVRHSARFQLGSWQTLSAGFNLSLLPITCGLLLALGRSADDKPALVVELRVADGKVRAAPKTLGAGKLGRRPKNSKDGIPQDQYSTVYPFPLAASNDTPIAYPRGCQAPDGKVDPVWCELGKSDGTIRAAILGDSKILQYFEALDAAGQALGWKMRSATKSGCPFVHSFTKEQCGTFRDAVMQELRANPPDFIITSHRSSAAQETKEGPSSERAMEEGLRKTWSELVEMGSKVIVVLDNPSPTKKVSPVYECLVQHPNQATRCAFDKQVGIRRSGAPVQVRAAQDLAGVYTVDLADYICPQKKCPPVIGNVLIYRQGSHVTNTYARTLAPILTKKLAAISEE